MKRWLIDHHWMSETDTWSDVVYGIFMLWTIIGVIGYAMGFSIGWWDLLGLPLPKHPRYAY